MQFMIQCLDKPDHLALRMENRAAHLEYLEGFTREIITAGPLLMEDGQAMIGSLFLAEFPSRKEAEAFAVNAPYRRAGLFKSVTIIPWRKVLPK